MDLCFLCMKENNCVVADKRIVSQVEYLLPEITIIKLGIPLRICSVCDGALCAFNKFKQLSVESSRRLEACIKGAQGPPLHTGGPPVVDDSETSGAKPEKMEEIFIKEEYVEETPLDTQMHTNRAFLDPNADNREDIFIKEEQIEDTPQDREFYNNILKEECLSNSMNDHTDRQPEHNTEDESETFNTNEQFREESSTDSGEETDGDCSKIMQTYLYSCYECNMKFKYKSQFKTHMKFHSTRVRNLLCKLCMKLFPFKYQLTYHYRNMHSEEIDSRTDCKVLRSMILDLKCKICEKSFLYKSNLNRHIKIHSQVKYFKCKICEKSFLLKEHLNLHIKFHSGVKEFQCEICGISFIEKNRLTDHKKIHSGVNKTWMLCLW